MRCFKRVLIAGFWLLLGASAWADRVENIHDFCQELNLTPEVKERIKSQPPLDVTQVQVLGQNNWSWLDLQIPKELVIRQAIWSNLSTLGYDDKVITGVWNGFGETLSAKSIRILQAEMRRARLSPPSREQISALVQFKDQVREMRKDGYVLHPAVNTYAKNICWTLGLTSWGACGKAVDEMLVKNQPSQLYGLFLEDLIEEVLVNPSYRIPVNRYAAKLIDHLFDDRIPVGNALEDLVAEFKATGLSERVAIRRAMNVFAFISLQGPEIVPVFRNSVTSLDAISGAKLWEFDRQILIPMIFISIVPSVLDLRQLNRGKQPYFLPPNVQSTCWNGKYYHFWMAAWWAFHFSERFTFGLQRDAAMAGVFTVAKSYQKFSETYGRTFLQAITEPLYSNYANHQRRDLVHYVSGIKFGRGLAERGNLAWKAWSNHSIDQDLQQLMTSGKAIDIEAASADLEIFNAIRARNNPIELVTALPLLKRLSDLWDKMFQVDRIFFED